MVGRKKRKDDDSQSSSSSSSDSDDEVLANIKKPSTSRKNGSKSNIKKTSGKTKIKSKRASEPESDNEPDYQPHSDDSESEVKKVRRSKVSRSSGRSNKKEESISRRPKRGSETSKRRSANRSETSHDEDSSQNDSQQSVTREKNGKGSLKKQKREPKPKVTPTKKEKEEEYEVEEILDYKIEDKVKYFLVRWKGYDSSADSWVYQRDLHCTGLISQFYEKRPEARITTHKRRKKDPYMPRKRNTQKKERKYELKIDERPGYDSEAFDENQEWKVERIIDVRYHPKTNSRDFLIHWEGFSSRSDSWEPEENLDCKELIKKFMAKLENIANATVKELRPVRKPTERYTVMDIAKGRRLSKRLDGRQRAAYYDCE